MTRHAVTSELAEEDLLQLADYIAEQNPRAARRFVKYVRKRISTLAFMPSLGAAWADSPIPDLRFWPLTRYKNYVIFYRPIVNGVEIIRILHGARDIPRLINRLFEK